jgi:hypothetical protein
MLRKRPCCICGRWFAPDHRVGARQQACSSAACQRARRARTQAGWRRRNPEYMHEWRLDRRHVEETAGRAPAALTMPPPLSSLAWERAREAFGLSGTDFLGQMGRVLLVAAKDQRRVEVVEFIGDSDRLPP